MLPVLFSINNFAISSFGFFLCAGFLYGIFLIWRLARAWDLDEERVLDFMLVTFMGALVGARIYFAVENWSYFAAAPFNLILVNKIPGFSFWGGFLGGWLTLYFFAKRKRADFWQLADIAIVGLLGGLILADLGCLLGSCNIGVPSKVFFAVSQIGNLEKRWPVQLFESVILIMVLTKVWAVATHFHQRGRIVGLGLTLIGVAKLIVEPLKQKHTELIFAVFFIVLGLTILFRIANQNPVSYFKNLAVFWRKVLTDSEERQKVVQNFSKSWYNQKANFSWKIRNLKKIFKKHNVKLS